MTQSRQHRAAAVAHVSRSFRRAALGVALVAASAVAQAALAPFTLDPAAAGLAGASSFVADNLLITDFATITAGGGNTFSEEGYLSVIAAQRNNATVSTPGLNSSYSLYIHFTGSGTSSAANPLSTPTVGSFSSLDYTIYGVQGNATFGFNGSAPMTSAVNPVALASGSLVDGNLATFPSGGTFVAFANANVSFNALIASVFSTPGSIISSAMTSFTNTSSEVVPFEDATGRGFMINSGGGSINFATTPVPEPSSYTLMLAGLAAVFGLSRRRSRRDA